jgi:hypothetical protein
MIKVLTLKFVNKTCVTYLLFSIVIADKSYYLHTFDLKLFMLLL